MMPAHATTVERPRATFIVRFSDEPILEDVCKTFRRDGVTARKKFNDWAASRPQMSGLSLQSASYSGEILVALPQNDPQGRTPNQVLAALQTMENLEYAEVDSIAHPSAGE